MTVRTTCLCLLLQVILITTGKAAGGNDSTLYKKAFTAYSLGSKKPDSAIQLARLVLAEAQQNADPLGKAMSLEALGWIFQFRGHLDSSNFYLKEAYGLYKQLHSDPGKLNTAIELSEINNKQSNFGAALQFIMEADTLSHILKNESRQAHVKRMLAIIYRGMGDNEKAKIYFKEAMAAFTKLNDKVKYAHASSSLAILYRNTGEYDSSLILAKENLAVALENDFDDYQVGMYHEGIADSYLGLYKQSISVHHYGDSALRHYLAAYAIFTSIKDSADIAWESYSLGKTYVSMKRYNDAEKYLKEALEIAGKLGLVNNQQDIASELFRMYEKAGDYKKALEYLKTANVLKDSVLSIQQIGKTKELQEKYEAEKKEQEIALLKKQNELAQADSKKTRLLQYIFLLLFVASVIIGWLLFNRLRIKRRLKEQMLRNQIAGDLHDDIGSALSSIDISSRIAMTKKENLPVVEKQLSLINQHAKKTMDSMSDIVWSINSGYDNFESIISRMRSFAAEICEPQQIGLQFSIPPNLEKAPLDSDKRKNIFLIFKEAVNNAVKYSHCSLLQIQFEKSNHLLKMSIHDNGKGFDARTAKKGNGLLNMQQRAAQLNGTLAVVSETGAGTGITLSFPL